MIGEAAAGFQDCEIDIDGHEIEGPICFRVSAGETRATFQMTIDAAGAHYVQTSESEARVRIGGKSRTLIEAFRQDPPHIYFADGDMLLADELFALPREEERTPFDKTKIEARDWSGVDLRKES